MKITSIDIIDVANDFQSASSKWRPVCVRINTDEGISGFGEVGLAYGVGASAGFGMAKDLARLLIGMNPMDTEAIWEKMFKKTFWGQGARHRRVRRHERPRHRLLGHPRQGPERAALRAAGRQDAQPDPHLCEPASVRLGRRQRQVDADRARQYAEAARIAVAEGYDALKVDTVAMDHEGNWNKRYLTGPLPDKVLRLGYDRLVAMREASAATSTSSSRCTPSPTPSRRSSSAR